MDTAPSEDAGLADEAPRLDDGLVPPDEDELLLEELLDELLLEDDSPELLDDEESPVEPPVHADDNEATSTHRRTRMAREPKASTGILVMEPPPNELVSARGYVTRGRKHKRELGQPDAV